MYVTMMMTDQIPLDLPPPLLNGEVPMMPHMVNGDGSQQVILVQVNPGETFTIRAEDGSLQCIQGPAEVPMMSPNGSIPPIHVPPGYISQVLEDNTGVRRVVVTPQSPECYPPSYSPAISPTHHLPPYLAHPHFIPNSHNPFYPPVNPGDMPPHQYYQHHLGPPMYSEEIIPVYGMSNYIGREEQYSKPQPKKIKERQLDRQNRLNSPPSSIYKTNAGCTTTHNGYGKSHGAGAAAAVGVAVAGAAAAQASRRRTAGHGAAPEPASRSSRVISGKRAGASRCPRRWHGVSGNLPARGGFRKPLSSARLCHGALNRPCHQWRHSLCPAHLRYCKENTAVSVPVGSETVSTLEPSVFNHTVESALKITVPERSPRRGRHSCGAAYQPRMELTGGRPLFSSPDKAPRAVARSHLVPAAVDTGCFC
ncbi:hypothetical protein MATL_G00243250 [Megalops atlanticus]|uniref:Fibronectin type III domain-containing protein 3B n=1 Tax=Megalops atlanticus TaxID=7932 RepID=A0A9D3PFZ7_MEGAT|nr:hypothetical protein MATL_G00243250 [Megalops atlanticus]